MENFKRTLGDLLSLIKAPVLTEKSVNLHKLHLYTFIVDKSMSKTEIKYLIEHIFKVKVLNVKTVNLPIKTKRIGKFQGKKSTYKKVYIKLKNGDAIKNIFD